MKGFAVTVTGITEADEMPMALLIAEHLRILFNGAVRFTAAVSALDTDKADGVAVPADEGTT